MWCYTLNYCGTGIAQLPTGAVGPRGVCRRTGDRTIDVLAGPSRKDPSRGALEECDEVILQRLLTHDRLVGPEIGALADEYVEV
jgi:hypothetical protein